MRDIWIFQLEEDLSPSRQHTLLEEIGLYLENWKAHGAPVPGSAEVRHDRFVIVRAEPGSTSGCSIDDMTRNITAILHKHGLRVLEPNFVFFRNGEAPIEFFDFRKASELVSSGKLGPETTIFNGSIQSANEFGNWEVKLADSWLNRFLPQKTV